MRSGFARKFVWLLSVCLFSGIGVRLLCAQPEISAPTKAQPALTGLNLALPTDNDALLKGELPSFYMYTDRIFEGRRSRPWQGGTYGFSRDEKRLSSGEVVMTRFHEGIDIKPTRRDADDEPLDDIYAIDDGKVVHLNSDATKSSYGRYIVLEHLWDGSRYYSFYAHLMNEKVNAGDEVKRGQAIARMGYTGAGLNKRRAHLHLEINLILSAEFEEWHDKYHPTTPNNHGIYNGINMAGLDVAELYLKLQENPSLTISAFLRRQTPDWVIQVPTKPWAADLYPWLIQNSEAGNPQSWEIAFVDAAVPIRIVPKAERISAPKVVSVRQAETPTIYLTRYRVTWSKNRGYHLTQRGLDFVDLITRDPK